MRPLVVFCPRPAHGSWAAGILRELAAQVEVRTCGPGWPARDLSAVDASGALCLLELDAAPGCVARPTLPRGFAVRRAAWLVDTPRKPELHREVARDCELVFHAHPAWAAALRRPSTWLPLCADEETFRPHDVKREWDVAFVGGDAWRAQALLAIAHKRGLRVCMSSPTGADAKPEAAAIYARSKLLFHRHLTDALDVRVLEATAAGRVVLVDQGPHRLEGLTEPGSHVLTYSSDEMLEAALVGLLGDERRRVELETRAASFARAHIDAKVRAAELLAALDAQFGARPAQAVATTFASSEVRDPRATSRSDPPRELVRVSPLRPPPTGVRWLVLADAEPPAVWLASYAERLGAALHARGDDVVVVRVRRGRLPSRPNKPGEPTVVEVDVGPVPRAASAENDTLLASARVQRVADTVAREHGPFQGLLVEPSLGAVVGPPLAARLGLPLVLALEDCEVARRGNHLTRDQLYRSELEHWVAARARLVVVPTVAVEAAVREHYKASAVVSSGWPLATQEAPPTASVERLRARLGLPAHALLVRAPLLGSEDTLALAADLGRRGRPAAVLGRGTAALATEDGVRIVEDRQIAGQGLAALAATCAQTILVGPEDLGAADVAALAPALGRAPEAKLEAVLVAVSLARAGQRLAPFVPSALEALARAANVSAAERRAPALTGSGP
ncbi:MAG: glycosyltransferase [Planctomycetota bacterium]